MRLSAAAAEAWIPRTCFKHGPPHRVGIELELLVHDREHCCRPTDGAEFESLRRQARALPMAGRVTVEPGGQLELSSDPADHLAAALSAAHRDLVALRAVASDHGAVLTGLGLDPREVRRRVLDEPRYAGMEAYLDGWGSAGRMMMRRTASLQVNLEAGDGSPGDVERRWGVLHAVGPPLLAAFANSPGPSGSPWEGWPSSRMGIWLALDPARTGQPEVRPGETVRGAWARWCLDAPLMLVRREARWWGAPPDVSFRDWLDDAALVPDRAPPSPDDLAYHLTTLFPPVRARGHLEVRYVDAQPEDWWPVPVAVLWALVTDPSAGREAVAACAGQSGRWQVAARCGLRDAGLSVAAARLLDIAAASLDADPRTAGAAAFVRAYRDTWTACGRSPADEALEGRPAPTAPIHLVGRAPEPVTVAVAGWSARTDRTVAATRRSSRADA